MQIDNSVDHTELDRVKRELQERPTGAPDSDLRLRELTSELREEIRDVRDEFARRLREKADLKEVDAIGSCLEMKVDEDRARAMIEDTKASLLAKIGKSKRDNSNAGLLSDLQEKYGKLVARVDKALRESKSAQEQVKAIGSETMHLKSAVEQAVTDEFKVMRQRTKQQWSEIWNETEELKSRVEELKRSQASKKDFADYKAKTKLVLEKKTDLQEVQEALNMVSSELSAKLVDLKKTTNKKLREIGSEMGKKADESLLNDTLTGKTDTKTVKMWVEGKANSSEIDALKSQLQALQK